jgi:hypothetical protein
MKPNPEIGLPPRGGEIVRMADSTPTPTTLTPMELLSHAVTNGASMEMIERLMALQERMDARQSRKEFDAAIAEAKAEIEPVVRNAKGHNDKKYADFAAIARAVDPVISRFGLSYRFRTTQAERISVTCILSHKSGHSEETTLSGLPDSTGNKNAIQAIGSTLTYLQRYSLVQALGLAAANDDDGAGASDFISDEQAASLKKLIIDTGGDVAKFCTFARIGKIEEIVVDRYDAAVAAVKSAAADRAKKAGK